MEDFKWKGNYDVTLNNVTESVACLSLAGPVSRDVLSTITDANISHEAFSFMDVKHINISGIHVDAIRISYTGKTHQPAVGDRGHLGLSNKAAHICC